MIGGYLYHRVDEDVRDRLLVRVDESLRRVPLGDMGMLFHDEPYPDRPTACHSSDGLAVLTQDILVCCDADGEYRTLDVAGDFLPLFRREDVGSLDRVSSDFRMAVIDRRMGSDILYLASNRAGAGRMYYHRLDSGILFASDLRFLLRVVPLMIEEKAIYAILKYGAVTEPMTVSETVSAVPPAHYLRYDCRKSSASLHPYFKLAFRNPDGPSRGGCDAALVPAKTILQKSARFLCRLDPAILLSGGIDSSLFACYLRAAELGSIRGVHCAFGPEDAESEYARRIADRLDVDLLVGTMQSQEAVGMMQDVVSLTDHPFSDFSSLPVVFILKFISERVEGAGVLIECNGGDDCFGFPALGERSKLAFKKGVPRRVKKGIASLFKQSAFWKWESREGALARVAAMADVHELEPSNYFLVLAPVEYLGLEGCERWDRELTATMEEVFRSCSDDWDGLGYEAVTTVKQLMHVNSRRWAAKALSVGEGLGIRCVYPYIWREVLLEQGKLPWRAKIHEGIVKWPLKRLLEEFMPRDFIYRRKSGFVPPFARWIGSKEFNGCARDYLLSPKGVVARIVPLKILDTLLSDALEGKRLRHPVLNFLWGALMTEMWVEKHGGR